MCGSTVVSFFFEGVSKLRNKEKKKQKKVETKKINAISRHNKIKISKPKYNHK